MRAEILQDLFNQKPSLFYYYFYLRLSSDILSPRASAYSRVSSKSIVSNKSIKCHIFGCSVDVSVFDNRLIESIIYQIRALRQDFLLGV